MRNQLTSYISALAGVAAVAWLTSALLSVLGLASSALLFLLPVVLASARNGLGPGLAAALTAAVAYNYFLLPPRFTLRIHGLDNVISLAVLVMVALVTSHLATRLRAREAQALEDARLSDEAAQLSAVLTQPSADRALHDGLSFIADRYGPARLVAGDLEKEDSGFSSLDMAAAAWSMHNSDITGHATQTMPAASWTFFPLSRSTAGQSMLAAIAQPADGSVRDEAELDQLAALCLLIGQCRDRAELESERRERESLEQRDALRRTLVASLSHDLRTPLTVLTGQLELHAADRPELRDALAAAQRLDRLLQDLLSAARIEAGSLAPALESLDLVDSINAACEAITPPIGTTLRRTVVANLPFVRADPVLLHHILINLLDNALRHARTAVEIGARAEQRHVVVTVSDDGPGIPESERARIFERFARLEGSDQTSGSGLGLAIVKGFADAMGMTVSVHRSPQGGAAFALAIPVPESQGQ